MRDDMFFSKDESSLSRGKRVAARTLTCRACLVAVDGADEPEIEGVVMDLTPFGLLVRLLEILPIGTGVIVQLMRDDNYREPFSKPLEGTVVRHSEAPDGLTDHGIKLTIRAIPQILSKRVPSDLGKPSTPRPRKPSRMHNIDYTVGDDTRRRNR